MKFKSTIGLVPLILDRIGTFVVVCPLWNNMLSETAFDAYNKGEEAREDLKTKAMKLA